MSTTIGRLSNVREIQCLIDQYSALKDRVGFAIQQDPDDIDYITYDSGQINVTGSYWDFHCQENEYFNETFPCEWLFLDDEELREKIWEKRRADHEAQRLKELAEEEETKRRAEEREREEYERLKAKYEGEG